MISDKILTKNSAETLQATLASLKNFTEVLILDTGSTDATLDIAHQFSNVRVVQEEFHGFGPTHNRASRLTKYDWVLSIDSDEILSPELSAQILSLTLNQQCVYSLDRHNYFNGKWIKCCAGWYPDHVVRLYHRGSTHFSDDAVHERVLSDGFQVVPLKGALLHTPYRTIESFLSKMQTYSTLFAEENKGRKSSSLGKAAGHAFAAFCKNYFIKKGFLGGKEGLIISLYNSQATYYKYLKLLFASKANQ